MWAVRIFLAMVVAVGLSGCAGKFKTYDGPAVTSVQVHKAARTMYLLHDATVLKTYRISLGFAPEGHKKFEGDGRTPEGAYRINRRNPNSAYHLSLGISYPNVRDVQVARDAGKSPGGDIFIHGWSKTVKGKYPDWTAGCIAVQDREIEEIYAMVPDYTLIHILP